MNVRVIIQMLCPSQSSDIVEMLRFPSAPLRPDDCLAAVTQVCGWESLEYAPLVVESILDELAGRRFTAIGATWQFSPRQFGDMSGVLFGVQQSLTSSTTNAVWFPTNDWPMTERPSRHGFFARLYVQEQAELRSGAASLPSCLETVLSFETEEPVESVLRHVAPVLAASIPGSVAAVTAFGIADGASQREPIPNFGRSIAQAFYRAPQYLATLGSHIDDLHDIVIGRKDLVDRLAAGCAAIGAECNEFAIEQDPAMAVIRLPRSLVDSGTLPETLRECVVQREDAPRPEVFNGMSRDEVEGVRIGIITYFTRRAYRAHRDIGTSRLAGGRMVYDLVIDEKYCEMLGLSADSMMVKPGLPELTRRERALIDENFAALSGKFPLEQRVWCAHRLAWKKRYPPVPKEFYDMVASRYFPKLEQTTKCK